jgi:hypothetical protein
VDAARGVLRHEHLGDVGDGLEAEDAVAALVAREHRGLLVGTRIAHREPDHEAVHLGLGQRVGPLVLHRVLGREDEERAGELVREHVDRDVALLHALEQTRTASSARRG